MLLFFVIIKNVHQSKPRFYYTEPSVSSCILVNGTSTAKAEHSFKHTNKAEQQQFYRSIRIILQIECVQISLGKCVSSYTWVEQQRTYWIDYYVMLCITDTGARTNHWGLFLFHVTIRTWEPWGRRFGWRWPRGWHRSGCWIKLRTWRSVVSTLFMFIYFNERYQVKSSKHFSHSIYSDYF